jgi:hypothetical protein
MEVFGILIQTKPSPMKDQCFERERLGLHVKCRAASSVGYWNIFDTQHTPLHVSYQNLAFFGIRFLFLSHLVHFKLFSAYNSFLSWSAWKIWKIWVAKSYLCSWVHVYALSKKGKGTPNLRVPRVDPEHGGYLIFYSKKRKQSLVNMKLGMVSSYGIYMLW